VLILKSTDSISVISSATCDIDSVVAYADAPDPILTASDVDCENQVANITTATTTTVVSAPGSGARNFKHGCWRNAHASSSCDLTFQFNRSGTLYELLKVTLLAGESLVFDDGTWFHYDTNGGVYGQALPAASDTVTGGIRVATQAEMEAASSLVLAVTPGRQQFHPSAAKFWVLFTGNSTTVLASYNTTSITDGTSEATVTIATDFSSANWAPVATAIGAASTAAGARLASARALAAGTAIVFCVDAQATSALADPTSWSVVGFGDQ
jgi:hypothetical protein